MTKVRFHGPIAGFSGAMGEMIFTDTKKKNRTAAYMKVDHEPTEGQLQVRANFASASIHATEILNDPAMQAFYTAVGEKKDCSAHQAALIDKLVAPLFQPLDLSEYKGRVGDKITVLATDDIGLADVEVTLTTNTGALIEKGKAVEEDLGITPKRLRKGLWTYTATAPVALGSDIFVEARGVDHAGNETVTSANPIVGADE